MMPLRLGLMQVCTPPGVGQCNWLHFWLLSNSSPLVGFSETIRGFLRASGPYSDQQMSVQKREWSIPSTPVSFYQCNSTCIAHTFFPIVLLVVYLAWKLDEFGTLLNSQNGLISRRCGPRQIPSFKTVISEQRF